MALFDPDDLVRIARRIDAQSCEVRAKGRSLVVAARHARWHSTAATTFREQVDRLDHRIQHAAHNLERAADELRAHAHRVRTAEAALATLARVEHAAAHETSRVIGAAEHGVRAAEHGVRAEVDLGARVAESVAGEGVHRVEQFGGWLGRHL